MGEDKKLDACVKKTQDALGKYLKKPPLTEKLLKKPPFRFLHDIITSVIKQYGLMQGLFTPAEMVSDNVKEKDAKIIFLQKVVDTMILISKENLSVKPSKIVAGQEPEKTNELLQAIAKALERKLDSTSAVQEVLGNNTDRGSNGKKSKATMQAVNGHSSKKDEKPTRTRPRRSDSKDSQDSPARPKEKHKKPRSEQMQSQVKEEEPVVQNEVEEKVELAPDFKPSAPVLSPVTTPVKSKAEETNDPKLDNGSATLNISLNNNVEIAEEAALVLGENDGPQKASNIPETSVGKVAMPPRPASTRPGSAKPRPLTARPAAPRLKERLVQPAAEEVILNKEPTESPEAVFSNKDEDDSEFVVEEAVAEAKLDKTVDAAGSLEEEASKSDHGILVSKILGTKRELEPTQDADQEVQWKGNEAVRQETNRLRDGLQTTVRAVNPLARLLDFLQEDIESMQLELEQWRASLVRTKANLRAERNVTEETLTSMRAQLSELDKALERQEHLNTAIRTNILMNNNKQYSHNSN